MGPGEPGHARYTYGQGNIQIAQANVSDVKAIKAALLDPPIKPDHLGMIGAIGTAGLVAYKILFDGKTWHVPASGYEAWVLLAIVLHAYQSIARYVKARQANSLTCLAIAHVNDLIVQVEGSVDDGKPVPKWWQFLASKKS